MADTTPFPPSPREKLRDPCKKGGQAYYYRKMIQLSKILVPTDFSEGSHEAFLYAIEIARLFGASVTVLHCVDDAAIRHVGKFGGLLRKRARAQEVKWAIERLERFLRFKEMQEVPMARRVALGTPHKKIVNVARRGGYGLIVMNVPEKSPMELSLFGSSADQVIRNAPCPVLSVTRDARRFVKP